MAIGDLFLKIALAAALATTTAILWYEWKRDKRLPSLFKTGVRISALFLTLTMVLLTIYFVKPNFNVDYVFARASLNTPLVYRISAVWAGQEGSFLLWTWAIAMSALLISELRGWRGSYERRVQVVVHLALLLFLGMTMASEPFAPTTTRVEKTASDYGASVQQVIDYYSSTGVYQDGVGFVDGQGISPTLMSPWMAIHPPLVFVAYGLLVVPFAASAVYLFSGKGDWEALSRTYSRVAWFFLTAGIVVGSFWAYEELSYGGYWTWDPIEIGSLISWLSLSAFLHGSIQARRKKTFQVFTPFLGLFTLILIIYATYVTRSGVIKSAHAYSGTAMGKYLVATVLVASTAAVAMSIRRLLAQNGNKKPNGDLTHQTFLLTIIAFFAIAILLTWGLTRPVVEKYLTGVEPPISPEFFNRNGFPFTLALALLGGFCGFIGVLRKERLFVLTGVAVGATALLALALRSARPEISPYATTFLPIGVFALASAIYRIYKNPALRVVGSHIVHLGVALLLIGVISSSTLQKTADIGFLLPDDMNAQRDVGNGYAIRLADINVDQDEKGNWRQEARVKVLWRGEEIGEVTERHVNDAKYGHYAVVSIFRGLRADVYPIFHGVASHEGGDVVIPIQVKVLPYINLVWIGALLSIMGMLLMLVFDSRNSGKKRSEEKNI